MSPAATKPRKRLKLLFADDERSLQELMRIELDRMGHEVTVCPDGLTAVAALERNTYDCIIVDLDMPGLTGVQVIAKCKELSPDTECVVLTGKSSLETAVAALRHGAFDYLTKPCKLVEIEALLNRVIQKRELTHKFRALKRRLESVEGTPQLVGNSADIDRVKKLIAKVAPTESTVLITGETGTGKELVARAVHDQSARSEMPFVAINCGALPESLIESELFGHRKGSFTGADEHRVGLFEVADGGTLFLDEIGELPKPMQAKLLRVLESGEIRRVGENQSLIVDVRVVCATHRSLDEMVAQDTFRQDLMFRVNTFEIHLQPLRRRLDDVPMLAQHLLKRLRPHLRTSDVAFTSEAIEKLQHHDWPGNVRELANVVEHAAILCDDLPITVDHLPEQFGVRRLRIDSASTLRSPTTADRASSESRASASGGPALSGNPISLRDLEMQAIYQALERNGGNKPKTAEELGISLKTLYNKLNQSQNLERTA